MKIGYGRQPVQFWKLIWTLLKRRKNYLHLFLMIESDDDFWVEPVICGEEIPQHLDPRIIYKDRLG